MNTIQAVVTYTGDQFLSNGLRFMEMSIPKQKEKDTSVPLLVFPNKAAGETFDVYQPGVRLLISGRLYPSRHDRKMYLIPNQQFQVVNDPALTINRVNLSGIVGYVQEKKLEDLFAFTLICNAPGQPVLGYNPNDGLGFRLDSWGEDAKRMQRLIHVGRGCSIEGVLRYNTWKDNNGNDAFSYQVRIRSGLYQCFGKNKNLVENADGTPVSNGYKAEAPAPVDATPCSVEPTEIPF
jgi:single-stranded DNA-binding protein